MGTAAEEHAKMRLAFYQNLRTLAVASLGGEVTLLNTVFLTVVSKTAAYFSIAALIFSAISALGAEEALLNRVSEPPRFRSRTLDFVLTPRLRTIEAQYGFEILC